MSSSFYLRQVKVHDDILDYLLPIYMHASVNPYLTFEIMDKPAFEPIFYELTQGHDLYVYEKNHDIAATCIVVRHKRRCQHIALLSTFAVHPLYQNQGVGTQFLSTLFQQLKESGVKRIELFCEADNLTAEKFYKKMGFEIEGRLKKYLKRAHQDHYVDDYMMAYFIDP